MESYKGRFEPTRFEDLTVTVDFHCHSACRFCIVQEGMNYFKGVPFEKFKQAVDDNVQTKRYRRVTFTGGEVTLEEKLFDYIDCAKQSKSFEHLRLQTNGRKLAERAFAERLIAAGIDEFFVSLHGHDAATQDHISQRPGSFDEAVAGMTNVKALGATLMTNTVLTELNRAHLRDLVETVSALSPARMELWNYLPMEDYADEQGLLSPMSALAPALREALARCKELGIEASVKYVPRCLLGEFADTQDNAQSDVVIVESFYDRYPKFSCLYEAKCEHSETCLGLHHPYIAKFGWEKELLVPYPRTSEWHEPEYGVAAGEGVDTSAWAALVSGVAERHKAVLGETMLQRRACVFRFVLGASSVDLVLVARDEEAQTLARSASFNIHYRNVRGEDKDALIALIKDAVSAVIERDPGGLHFDARKGLVGAEAVRRRHLPTA
jgi:MoaA/NifB/PqqE/SkfB family radical SAM enzyme